MSETVSRQSRSNVPTVFFDFNPFTTRSWRATYTKSTPAVAVAHAPLLPGESELRLAVIRDALESSRRPTLTYFTQQAYNSLAPAHLSLKGGYVSLILAARTEYLPSIGLVEELDDKATACVLFLLATIEGRVQLPGALWESAFGSAIDEFANLLLNSQRRPGVCLAVPLPENVPGPVAPKLGR